MGAAHPAAAPAQPSLCKHPGSPVGTVCAERPLCCASSSQSHCTQVRVQGLFCGQRVAPSGQRIWDAGSDMGASESIAHPSLLNQELLQAASDGDHILVQVALLSGADVHARQALAGRSASKGSADGAREAQRRKGLGSLREAAVPSAASTEEGMTALMHAAKGGHVYVVKVLLQAGAQINDEDAHGRRPLHFAALSGSEDAYRILTDAGAVHPTAASAALDPANTPLGPRREPWASAPPAARSSPGVPAQDPPSPGPPQVPPPARGSPVPRLSLPPPSEAGPPLAKSAYGVFDADADVDSRCTSWTESECASLGGTGQAPESRGVPWLPV